MLVTGNTKLLQGARLSLPRSSGIDWRCQKQVRIMVEGTEHGYALQKLLSRWDLMHCRPEHQSNHEVNKQQEGLIVTLVHAMRHGIDGDMLIRSTGSGQGGRVRKVCGAHAGSTPPM